MRPRRCVMERKRLSDGTTMQVWHVVPAGQGTDPDANWCPIDCDSDTVIVMPGPLQTREPTCPKCQET